MSNTNANADNNSSAVSLPDADDAKHTEGGAPTDKAHEEVGDGSTTGSIPAGLTLAEMDKLAEEGNSNDGGTG